MVISIYTERQLLTVQGSFICQTIKMDGKIKWLKVEVEKNSTRITLWKFSTKGEENMPNMHFLSFETSDPSKAFESF